MGVKVEQVGGLAQMPVMLEVSFTGTGNAATLVT